MQASFLEAFFMKKNLLINIIVLALILMVLARITGALRLYAVSSYGTEPNLKYNTRFVGSNLISPKHMEFSYYQRKDDVFNLGDLTIVQRLIAMPGDVLECKKGEFYVNGKNVDDRLNLRRMYKLHETDYENHIKAIVDEDEGIIGIPLKSDSIAVTLNEDFVATTNVVIEKYLVENLENALPSDINIENLENEDWNVNSFGPIKMPEGKYFFLGDNRDNSMDSRYFGFVNEEDIKGTLLFQF